MQNMKVINEYECVFCGQKKTINVKDVVVDKETGRESWLGMDGWTCHTCGNNNAIYDDIDYLDFSDLSDEKLFKKDVVELFLFSEYLVSKKEFEKASRIMKHILTKDPEYYQCKSLFEDVEKLLELILWGYKSPKPRISHDFLLRLFSHAPVTGLWIQNHL